MENTLLSKLQLMLEVTSTIKKLIQLSFLLLAMLNTGKNGHNLFNVFTYI